MSSPPTSPLSLSERLQDLTEALAAARTPGDVLRVVLTPALDALGAVAGAVLLVSAAGDRLELAALQGDEEGAQTLWQDGPLDGNVPAADALERREALFFEHQGDLVRAYPELEARTGGVAAVATAVLPMFLDERPLGVILLDFGEPHDFTGEEKRFLRTLAAQCALALGRAQLTRHLERRVEERTREVEAERNFLRALLGSLGESIVACDAGGRLTLFNGVARELHGLDAEPVPPESWATHYGLYGADGTTPLAPTQVPLYRAWQGEHLENAEMVIRQASGETRTVLVNGQPILGAGGERLGAVVAQRDITKRRQQERELAAAHTRAEVLAALGDALQQATTPEEVAELALDRIGPAVGARGMLVVRLEGEALRLPTVWGQVPGAITAYLGRPGRTLSETTTFQEVVRSGQAVYLDHYRPRGGAVPSFPTQAAGIEPVRTPRGALRGFLLASRPVEAGTWQPGERDLLRRAAGTLGLALERAEMTAQLETRSREIEEEARAREAFVAFAEAVGTELNIATLAQRAVEVLQAHFVDGLGGYYEREGELWKLRSWTRDLDAQPDFIAALRAGLPGETPFIAQVLRERTPVFTEHWDAAHEGIRDSGDYGTVAACPVIVEGEVRGFFTLGFKTVSRWAERDRAVVRAVGHSLSLAVERVEQARQLQARKDAETRRTQALQAYAELSRELVLETDPLVLIRRTQEIVLALLPPGFSGYFEPGGGRWRMASQVGPANTPELQAALDAGLPFEAAANLLIPWRRGEPHYQDEYDPALDHLTGSDEYPGASVTIPIVVGGQTRGILGFALYRVRFWSGEDRAVLETVGRQLTLALERAEQTRRLEEERAALGAFARFTEASTRTTDALTLAEEAKAVLRATLGVEVGYSELEDGRWKGRVFSENTPPEVMAQSRRGFPADLPAFARPFEARDVVFVDGWDPRGAEHTDGYTAAALYPYFEEGRPHGLLTMGTSAARAWTERERSVFRSVGRSLALAFERAEGARQLQVQNAELGARTRALEGFANLTRDLSVEVDPYVLVRRAQAVALSLLPEGYALYFEPEGERWVLRGQTGDLRSEALQAVANAGLPYDEAGNLLIPYRRLAPYYQDQYARDTDHLDELVAHLGASATLPVTVNGRVRGVFAVVLFGGTRHWTRPDQSALESVVHSLGLALERAENVAELEARTREVAAWRERYEVAVRGSGALLYDWDPATDSILYGGAVEQITGYTPQELDGNLGDWTNRLIHPEDREAFRQEIARVIKFSDTFHLPFRLVHKGGQVREVEDDGYFKRDARGEVTQMVGFVRDVTERKRAEESLARSNAELRRSNEELEQFAYIASHDLQAPIRAVTSFAGVIDKRYGPQLDERGRLYLRQIVESGEHMKRLVDDLLTFSRVHTEQRPPRVTDSGTVCDAVLTRLHPEIERTGASVTRGGLPRVVADPQQLDQLLQNLVGNGLKYRREGVTPEVRVSAEREGRMWRFAVTDNGIGIEPQYYERIFVIFQRLHGRETYEGTGIGLAVCKKIVERHGGRLWLESTPGQGSTFFFTLPVT